MKKYSDYNSIKNAICDSVCDKIVSTSKEEISVFEYLRYLNEYFKPLTNLRSRGKEYASQMNLKIASELSKGKLPKKDVNYLKNFKVDDVDVSEGLKSAEASIVMHRKIFLQKSHYYQISAYSENDKVTIGSIHPYYTSNTYSIRACLSYCNDILKNIIAFGNQYNELLLKILQDTSRITTDLYNIKLTYFSTGYKARIRPNFDNIDEEVYFNKAKGITSIQDIINQNADLILWSTPISMDLIPEEIRIFIDLNKDEDFTRIRKR